MSLTRTQIEDAIRTAVVSASGAARAIIGWPGAARPDLPYLTVRLLSVRPFGLDDAGAISEAGIQTFTGDRVAVASVQAFGAGALDLLRSVQNGIFKETVRGALLMAGLAPRPAGQIDDLTEMLESDPEERAHLDIEFGLLDQYTDDVGFIEEVIGQEKVKSDSGETTTFDFDVKKSVPPGPPT